MDDHLKSGSNFLTLQSAIVHSSSEVHPDQKFLSEFDKVSVCTTPSNYSLYDDTEINQEVCTYSMYSKCSYSLASF